MKNSSSLFLTLVFACILCLSLVASFTKKTPAVENEIKPVVPEMKEMGWRPIHSIRYNKTITMTEINFVMPDRVLDNEIDLGIAFARDVLGLTPETVKEHEALIVLRHTAPGSTYFVTAIRKK